MTLCKKLDNFRYVLIRKKQDKYVTRFFMKFLKVPFIYKNHDTLRHVTFLYTKSQRLRKKQDKLHYVFKYKNLYALRYTIFHCIFEIGGLGVIFKSKNNALCITFFYPKNNALCVMILYLKFIV